MDEPSNGVDPISRKNLYTYLKTLKTTSSLIITHRIDEAEKICDKIAIMNAGEFIDIDDPIGLKDKYGTVFILQVEPMVHTAVSLDQIDDKITRTFDFCQRIYSSKNYDFFEIRPSLTYRFDNIYAKQRHSHHLSHSQSFYNNAFDKEIRRKIASMLKFMNDLLQNGVIADFSIYRSSLEQVFKKIIK
jgi:ABC-type multidrug transport system ATPase subunit